MLKTHCSPCEQRDVVMNLLACAKTPTCLYGGENGRGFCPSVCYIMLLIITELCDAVIRCYSNDVLCVLLVSQDSTAKGAAPDLTFEAILEFVQRKYK